MHIIACHENADFDAVASLLGAHKLFPDAVPLLPKRMNANVRQFITLYRSGLPFARADDAPNAPAEHLTLVDTQRVPNYVRLAHDATPITIIDHHPAARDFAAHEDAQIDPIGATVTLLVERMRAANIALTTLEATLLALGIYEDTGAFTYRTTHVRDLLAAAWLIEQGAVLDRVRRFLEPPLNDAQQALLETLVTTAESRSVQGFTVLVAAAQLDEYLNEISAVAHRLRDTLDPTALFLLVEMPNALHLVCRSTDDAIDVSVIARFFGGGGHERAAAATIRDYDYATAHALIWEQVERAVKPAARVADLMSAGAQTIEASARVGDVIARLRRIGHEGYPVIEAGRVIGLLTRRDADRAVEHGLHNLSVRDVMIAGEITLNPDDAVSLLEARMVASGWGQIPVIDDAERLIGIVTRTDLITPLGEGASAAERGDHAPAHAADHP